jgi:hypothetical protein
MAVILAHIGRGKTLAEAAPGCPDRPVHAPGLETLEP